MSLLLFSFLPKCGKCDLYHDFTEAQFIAVEREIGDNSPIDWRTPQNNNLWQGVSGTNNPCPAGFRLPTETELETEKELTNATALNKEAAQAFATLSSEAKRTANNFENLKTNIGEQLAPAATELYLYAKDDGGEPKLFYRNDTQKSS